MTEPTRIKGPYGYVQVGSNFLPTYTDDAGAWDVMDLTPDRHAPFKSADTLTAYLKGRFGRCDDWRDPPAPEDTACRPFDEEDVQNATAILAALGVGLEGLEEALDGRPVEDRPPDLPATGDQMGSQVIRIGDRSYAVQVWGL